MNELIAAAGTMAIVIIVFVIKEMVVYAANTFDALQTKCKELEGRIEALEKGKGK